jgi:hypothetical protein
VRRGSQNLLARRIGTLVAYISHLSDRIRS